MAGKREKGASAVFVALMLPVIVAALGLVVDAGHAYDLKRRLQKIADAAALTAAHELRRGNVKDYASVARRDAERNYFAATDGSIDIVNPPKTGPRTGDSSFVEVRVRGKSPAYFMKILAKPDINVEAVAIGGILPAAKCVYSLDPHATRSLWVGGNAKLDLGKCGIFVNSDDKAAARTNGGATVTAGSIEVVGDYVGAGFSPNPVTGGAPQDDPWADMPAPAFAACKAGGKGTTVKSAQTLNPGVFCGGLTITTKGAATLKPGLYVVYGGGLKVQGSGSITGSDVTFFVSGGPGYTYGSVDLTANSKSVLTAPTSGKYAGVLFFQDRNVTSSLVNNFSGNASMTLSGGMYFPTTDLKFTGTAGASVQKLVIIARNVELHGNAKLNAPDAILGTSSLYTMRTALVY